MGFVNVNSDFTAAFGDTYVVDNSEGNIVVTLPDPSGNNNSLISFILQGTNKLTSTGYNVSGTTMKVKGDGDVVNLIVVNGSYIMNGNGYFVDSDGSIWRMTLSILGITITTKIT